MDDRIDVGAMLFTMVDPHRGHEVAYNRWYEQDHFYAGCMIGPGMLSGSRWVATRALKDLRFPEVSPFAEPVDAGSYLAIYWMNAGQEDEWGAWASTQVWALYEHGRGFNERTHAQTGLYNLTASSAAGDHPVPLALALDHRYGGLLVVVVEPANGDAAATAAALHDGPLTALLATGSAASASSWTVRRPAAPAATQPTETESTETETAETETAETTSPMPLGATGGSPDRVVQLMFCEGSPSDSWDDIRAYAAAVASQGLGTVTFAAPFLPTNVGTDQYTNELW